MSFKIARVRSVGALCVLVAALCGCSDEYDDNDYLGPCIPQIMVSPDITIAEGGNTTFEIALTDSTRCGGAGRFYFYHPTFGMTRRVKAEPAGVVLTEMQPAQIITLTALPDADVLDETLTVEWYLWGAIGGESPSFRLLVVDREASPTDS